MVKQFILSIVLSLTVVVCVRAQKLVNPEREYFILGTLSDYMGRQLDPRDTGLLDRYYANEGILVNILDTLISRTYPNIQYKVDRYQDGKGNPQSFKIFSSYLSKRFNNFYSFEPSGNTTSPGDEPILLGKLRVATFTNKEQKLAFLAGAWVRFGMHNDTAYFISAANSVSKAQICTRLLKELHCRVSYQIMTDYIPVGHRIYFHPTAEVKAYLDKYNLMRRQLQAASDAYILSLYHQAQKALPRPSHLQSINKPHKAKAAKQ